MFFKFTHALETHSLHQKQKRCLPKTKSRDKRLKILSLLFVLQGRLSQVMSLVKLSLETLLKSKTRVRQKTRDIIVRQGSGKFLEKDLVVYFLVRPDSRIN